MRNKSGCWQPAFAFALAGMATGVALFWIEWFVTGKHLHTEDLCYRIFENCFPLPDGIMAIFLLLTAGLIMMNSPWAALTGLLAAGMSLHLGALDLVYHLQQRNLADWANPETWSRAFIIAVTLGLGSFTVAWFARQFPTAPSSRRIPTAWRVVAGLIVLELAFTLVYWYTQLTADHSATPECAREFHQAFFLADGLNVATGAATLAGMVLRKGWGVALGLVHAGLALFGTLIYGAFSALNPDLIEGQQNAYSILLVSFLFYISFLTWAFWRHRPGRSLSRSG
ncbi:MAG: hypothetical protein IT368_02415 [Candidatus Hydrogenedentes bacterium]|nr:hypothetical protein [Candidatus Hydrogenedentota bacterium]